MPKVSVVIPCYNLGQYINEAVDSVLAQTYQDFEIIIVNDGSTDEWTNQLLDNYSKPKTRVIKTENRGLPAARNLAISEAMGEYILPLDADDKIAPTFLEKTVKILEQNPKVGFVTTWTKSFKESNHVWKTEKFELVKALATNITAVSSLFRRKCWEEVGGYNEQMTGFHDWDFWLSVAEKGWGGEIIKEPLFFYRVRKNSMFKTSSQKENHLRLIGQMIDKHANSYQKYFKEVILEKEKNNIEWREMCQELQKMKQPFNLTSQEKDDFLQEILNSTSWKITAPLRWTGDKIKNLISTPLVVLFLKKFIPKKLKPPLKKFYNQLTSRAVFIPTLKTTLEAWPNDKPLVSIIIPCYNYGQYLEEAIDSVLNSTFQDFEIIVVDDGSTELATIEVLNNLHKPKTKIIHQKNLGLATARNNGIKIAQGKYICCLDADDKITPTYLEKCLEVLESQPEIGFVYSWVRLFGDENDLWRTEEFDLPKLMRYNHISVSSVFRRDGWEAVGGYNPNMIYGYEDWDFWLSLTEIGLRGKLIPEPLFLHRRHGKTMTYEAKEKYDYLVKQLQINHKELFTSNKSQKIIKNYKNYLVENYPLNTNGVKQYQQKNKKRVLCLLPHLAVGGGQAVVYEIMNGLKNIFDFFVMTALKSQNEWHDKFTTITPKIYHLPNFLNQNYWEDYLPHFVAKHQIDTVFLSGAEFAYQVLEKIKSTKPEVKIVTLLHNDSKWGHADLDGRYDQHIDFHLGVNEKIKKLLIEKYHLAENKIKVIYNAIDTETKFNPLKYPGNQILVNLNLPKNKKIIAWIGRLSEEKTPLDFLKLAETMKKQTDFFFAMFGEGPLKKFVQKRSRRLKNFKLFNYTDRVPEILKNIHALVLTSTIEGLPMIILEAGAMGLPVVSTDVGEVNKIIINGQNGYLVKIGDIEAMKEKINTLDKLLPKQKIRQMIADNFSLKEFLNRYAKIL